MSDKDYIPEDTIIPYIAIKYSNNDLILCELVSENTTAMVVRNAICLRKAFITDANGVKRQKKIASVYCELARNGELIVPKSSCNYIAVLRDVDRPYYEILVEYHINKKRIEDDEEEKEETSKESENKEKVLLH